MVMGCCQQEKTFSHYKQRRQVYSDICFRSKSSPAKVEFSFLPGTILLTLIISQIAI